MSASDSLEEKVYKTRFQCAFGEYAETNKEYRQKWIEYTKSGLLFDKVIGYLLKAGWPVFNLAEAPVAISLTMLSCTYSKERKGYVF
jgi:hypothetical protein